MTGMVRMRCLWTGLVLVAMALAVRGCDEKRIHRTARAGVDAPLLLDDKPLLLENDPASSERARAGADNSRCYVCHINYVREKLAARHARADIGCARCHGASDAHIADESWASGGKGTPPEIMYPRPKINPLCLSCHKAGELGAKRHKDVLAGLGKNKYCTDCHGKHRLAKRRCKWK